MKTLVWGLVIVLIVLHQDFWFWDDATLVAGFCPIGLLYHMGISLAAGLTWILVIKYEYPNEVDTPKTNISTGDADA